MSTAPPNGPTLSRRGILVAAVAAGTAGAVGPAAAAAAASPPRWREPRYQVPGVKTEVDVSHATSDIARRLDRYFTAKSAHDVEATMAHLSREALTYSDATIGFSLTSWEELHSLFAAVMPTWAPGVLSYPTRIVGDDRSAVVDVTTTPGAFAPTETRITSAVDIRAGRVVRWVDYWDGRHITLPVLRGMQVPPEQHPADLGESRVRSAAAPVLQERVRALTGALADGDATRAARSFSDDAVLEDATAHLSVRGRPSIEGFLSRVSGRLPYASRGVAVRHVVGGVQGGAWEWTATGSVRSGITVLELDRHGLVSRFTATWDGSLATATELTTLASLAVEE